MIWCGWCCHSDLGEEGIGADGAGMLAGVLGQCSSLTKLDLEDNGIDEDGFAILRACWPGDSGLCLDYQFLGA